MPSDSGDNAVVATLAELRRHLRAKRPVPGHIALLHSDLNGGKATREHIATIGNNPDATALTISGLDQDTFEFLVAHYGRQFAAIHFWKCPRVADLTPLEELPNLTHVAFFWNPKCRRLWNFRRTAHLRGLRFEDFTGMASLDDLAAATSLEELEFGDAIWTRSRFQSLEPLSSLRGLRHLDFNARRIEDDRIEPLAKLTQLTSLDFPSNLFATEQIAWLRARLPATVVASVLAPTRPLPERISRNGKQVDTLVIGKKKPILDSTHDREKLQRYRDEFASMVDYFARNPKAGPAGDRS